MRTHSRSHNSRVALLGLGVMATIAALVGDGSSSAPAEAAPVDGAPDSIREIDFSAVAQPGNVCAAGLDERPPLLVLVDEGATDVLDPDSVTRIAVAPEVQYGDVDGDGADDAVVHVVCNYGANGEQDTVQVWTMGDHGPVVTERVTGAPDDVVEASEFPPGVSGVVVDGDDLVITYDVHAEGDPNCCPSGQAVVRYQAVDGDLVAEPASISS